MAPHDIIIDDDEECCPLCVEEFDLSDKNFRPCPCGYQVCQFCFNNIKTNMNGLCPACRRPYDEKTIEWKVVTPEEVAQFKANLQKNAKKKQEQRQKEAQKREVESLNRKHLSGLRVVQKNLVYVVGLSPNVAEKEILETLRGDKYFGQYGKIIKIVVSNKKDSSASGQPQSLGVYVTFARKEDAARCITAVNGSQNGDRVLRAQLGTTKYCSAYLRNEICTNKNCMFLHEPGDNDDSYSRQDLSSINSVNTQRPLPVMASSSSSSRQAAQAQAQAQAQAPLQLAQPVAAAVQPMLRDESKDGSDSGDGSALPTTASWANRGGVPQPSRRGSLATSAAASSPAVTQAVPLEAESTEELQQEEPPTTSNELPSAATATQNESAGPERDPALVDLLKEINSSKVSFTRTISTDQGSDPFSSFPPLFDELGGKKRKAMREQQEEARLSLEQESQADLQSVHEPVEEEAPQGGSFQLGGEPEDRDNGREGSQQQNYHAQRRPSAQAPIHRGSNGGIFGPNLNLPFQNVGSLSSINGRPLTAHQQNQLALMKSTQAQSGYIDQYPPGMGNFSQGAGLFQQQGHNRQASRYAFANDGSSTSSVKPSANSKLMAQQSSMMPTVPHGNQYGGSMGSMPGPPPGLKSTATPPIGGMFSQANAFGSMGAGAIFGGAQREPNEFLQQMFRGGNRGGQSHDTGKREYNFSSSFLQQYPSASSTPAPASGFLASLYGPQTGAFQDYGQKQKKKGKKHRHANTSSSGGGGLVNDLADPSILQARMHHQQSSAGVGQVFGGQVQDDLGPLALDADVTSSIDALVADDDAVLPPSPDNSNQVSRSSTPAVPPGFSLPHAHPPTAIREEPVTKVPTRFTPTSAPFTPARNPAIPRVATPLSLVTAPQTTQSVPKSKTAVSTSLAKQDVKALATDTGLSKAIASQSSQPALQSEDFPALESGKAKVQAVPPVSSKNSTQPKPAVTTTSKKPSTVPVTASQAVSKAAEKHSTPAPNASVPTKSTIKTLIIETPTSTPAPVKSLPPSDYPSLPSASTVASFQSPPPRPAMKSLRVVPTPKTEILPAGSATPSSATSMFPPALPSRQASLALRPSTPSSEIISDNASITSASISRASSPPPSKIGSAPVRENTKAATRRLRKEKAEAKEKADAEARAKMAEPTPEVAIAPIMGRKKKQKKERTVHSAAGGSTPVVSRPPSPGPAEAVPEEPKPKPTVLEQAGQAPQKQSSSTAEQETTRIYSKGQDSKGKGKAKAQPAVSPEPTPPAPEVENEQADKPIPTPASVFHHLIAEGLIDDVDHLFLLKNPIVNHQVKTPIDPQSINPKVTISPEDRQTLLAGEPVVKVGDGPSRIVLTPNGDCIRNLTPEEEQRYLDLQARIASDYGPASFTSAKHHSGNGFALIGGRAVSNGTPTFFPASSTGAPAMDPVSKIQRDEALGYINQYVLPSMSTNQQIEKALNVKPNETDIIHAGDAAAWTNWGSDGHSNSNRRPDNGAEPGYGPAPTNREGMIANGLESMTAHITIGGDLPRAPSGQPLGSVALLTLTEAEGAMQLARKETEGFEKRLNALIKKNRRLLLPSSH